MSYGTDMRQGIFSIRASTDFAIGGGSNGPDGHIVLESLTGLSVLAVIPRMRVFLLGGLGGEYRSNDVYLYSHLDLPLVQLGAVYTDRDFSFRAGALGAYAA